MRDLAGRSDPTSRKSFKGSIKFIPITFLWNAQQAHALSMKIIFDLIDVSFGKNHFFEPFLINHLGFFISDSVIISCIFIKEPNFNLYPMFVYAERNLKKNANLFTTKFQIFNITKGKKCEHSGILLSSLSTLPVMSFSFLPLFVVCSFLFLGTWSACGNPNINDTTKCLNGVLPPRQTTHCGSKIVSSNRC